MVRRDAAGRVGQCGFSLVELVIAIGLTLLLSAAALGHRSQASAAFDRQSESGDMDQRLRAAWTALRHEVSAAGASGAVRADGAPLSSWAPAVWPARIGLRAADSPGTVRRDAVTIITARPLPSLAMTTADPLAAASGAVRLAPTPGCPPLPPACGLRRDDDVLVADGEGAFHLFTVTDVIGPVVSLRVNTPASGHVYAAGSTLVPVNVRTYYLRPATGARPPQLARYEGGAGPDVPVVDHVVGFEVEYFGDPAPPRMQRPLSDLVGPWTSYGPRPPVADRSVTPYLSGGNCLYAGTGTPLAVSLLPALGPSGSALVPLPPAALADGPWCPDAATPARYDADLLRVRSIGVTLRVESALAALRGPAGVLFARGGTARAADLYAPDIELKARITPANLAGGR